ncbi:MAG: GGDEF domain-containing protein [Gemmatimonadetes bacterium]|nr:GGDEF domain-containing protein [Gemmatimonadota bacterium]
MPTPVMATPAMATSAMRTPAMASRATTPAAPPAAVATPAWARTPAASATPAIARAFEPHPGAGAALPEALDALGRVLQAYQEWGFDTAERSADTVGKLCGRFRDHLLEGRPLNDEPLQAVVPPEARRYAAIAEFLWQQRRDEKVFVEAALADLRDALWACVNRVQAAVASDVKADAATGEQVQRVHHAINRLETGSVKQEVLQAINNMEEIARERRSQQMTQYGALAARIDQLGSQLETLKKENETDPLTGLGNRKRFDSALARAMQTSLLGRQPLTLVMMDMDGLKGINDSFGHPAGDEAIKAFADCLSRVFLRNTDILCRLGGDEFAAILPNTEARVVARMADRLITQVAETALALAPRARIGASMGYSGMQAGESPEQWVARTDAALYQAKAAGKGRAIAA